MVETDSNKKIIIKKALSLISQREYSVSGLKKKLLLYFSKKNKENLEEKNLNVSIIEEVVNEFVTNEWICDKKFVESFLNMKGHLYGKLRLSFELRKLGISEELIKERLEENSSLDLEKARILLDKKFSDNASSFKDKIKQRDFLIRRGFSFDVSKKVALEK